jgi:hypothetical protein
MDETESTESRLAITLQIRKSDYADGVDGVSKWKVEVDRAVARTNLTLTREIILSILKRGVMYAVPWEDEVSIATANPGRDVHQLTQILKASHRQSAKEVTGYKAAVVAAYASIFDLFGPSSLEVLMADPEFRSNDAGARDPIVTWERFMCTHVTEREGKGTVRCIISTKRLMATMSALEQAPSESLTDFYDRFLRLVNALKDGKLDLCAAWLVDDESLTGFFLVSLCPSRFSGLIRDVLNGVLKLPDNIIDLMRVARDRKEAKEYTGSTKTKVLVMGESTPTQAIRSPLDPFPAVCDREDNNITPTELEYQRIHNTNLEQAGRKLYKMGWINGRFQSSPKTTNRYQTTEKSREKVMLVDNEPEWDSDVVLATNNTELVEINDDNHSHLTISEGRSSYSEKHGAHRRSSRATSISHHNNSKAGNRRRRSRAARRCMEEISNDDEQSIVLTRPPRLDNIDSEDDSDYYRGSEGHKRQCLSTTCSDLVEIDATATDPAHNLWSDSDDENHAEPHPLDSVTEPIEIVESGDNPNKPPLKQGVPAPIQRDQGCMSPYGYADSDEDDVSPFYGRRSDTRPTYAYGSIEHRERLDRRGATNKTPKRPPYYASISYQASSEANRGKLSIDSPEIAATLTEIDNHMFELSINKSLPTDEMTELGVHMPTSPQNEWDMVEYSAPAAVNNAAVKMIVRNGISTAVMCATANILQGEEIKWGHSEGDQEPRATPKVEICLNTSLSKDSFHADYVILDCASGTNLCKSRRHANDVKPCVRGTITGIEGTSGGTHYDESCSFVDPALGRMPLATGASANIISLAVARDKGFVANYCNDRDEFTIVSPSGGRYVFGRLPKNAGTPCKFYVMSLQSLLPPSEEDTRILCATGSEEAPVERPTEGQKTASHQSLISSVQGNKDKYTVAQNKEAVLANEYLAAMGFPSLSVAIAQARGMRNCPVSVQSIQRAFDIFGPPIPRIQGCTKKRNDPPARPEVGISSVQKEQIAEVDLFFVRGIPFLIAILTPLEYSFALHLKDKSTESIVRALEAVLVETEAKGFKVQWVRSDNEPAMGTSAMAQLLSAHGTSTDRSAPGQHAPRVERRIQFVKEKHRSLMAHVPYKMSMLLVWHSVLAANRFTNMQQASSSVSPLTPREKFLGCQVDYDRDIGHAFGTYVQATGPNTDSSDRPRTEAYIYLYPTGVLGHAKCLKISGHKVVVRTNVTCLPITDALIDHLNEQAVRDALASESDDEDTGGTPVGQPSGNITPSWYDEITRMVSHQPTNASMREKPAVAEPSSVSQEICHAEALGLSGTGIQTYDDTAVGEAAGAQPTADKDRQGERRSARIREKEEHDEEYPYWDPATDVACAIRATRDNDPDMAGGELIALNLTIKQALEEYGVASVESVTAELQQLLDKGFAHALGAHQITAAILKSAIPLKMFIKAKLAADGSIVKLKSRYVARGDRQDRELYIDEDLSASTADCMTVYTVLAIAASEGRHIMAADIGGAYLNASMSDESPPVYIMIEPRIADIMSKLDPSFSSARRQNGTIIAKLKKCLYGCIESAKRWQLHVVETLTKLGFVSNPYDPCLLNKTCKSGAQTTVVLYVDDLLVTSVHQQDIQDLLDALRKKYKDVTANNGPIVEYLGQRIDMSTPGTASITMDGMTERIIVDSLTMDLNKFTPSPAADAAFEVPEDSPLLNPKELFHFHSIVARILYLSKRARPDLLLAISNLTTRVTKATNADKDKLDRIIRYMHQSYHAGHKGIKLTPGPEGIQPFGFFDASYGVHADGKSHTGACIMIGAAGPVSTDSTRQSIVSKSSTEAELVGMSDSTNQLIHLRRLLIAQGYPLGPAIVYQDNMSAMALAAKGRPTSKRSRHIDIRYFWVTERCDVGDIKIVHRPTELMGPANILTKPVQAAQFVSERHQLTNWN